MGLCINSGATKAVKAFVKQVRKTGIGDCGISQQLENGARISAHKNPDSGLIKINYRTISDDVFVTDHFVAKATKGKPKHTMSEIVSDTGALLFQPGKKDF